MPTIAHRPSGLLGRAPRRLTTWLIGAVLVAALAAALALSLTGSGVEQTEGPAGSSQATPQAPTPFGGAHP